MQHKLIKTDNYLLVVDDSEIKTGDYVLSNLMEVNIFGRLYTPSLYKKIIAHLPINAPILEGVPLLPPLEDEVEKLARTYTVNTPDNDPVRIYAFIAGYNKAKEKYKYTEQDMLEFAIWRSTTVFTEPYTPLGEFILWESLQQPKLPVAFACEMITMNKGYTEKSDYPYQQCDIPKTTTNSQGQTQLVGTYIYE
jgi:hypothetical protein